MKKIITRLNEFVNTSEGMMSPMEMYKLEKKRKLKGKAIKAGDEKEAPVAPPKPGTKPNPPGILPGTRPSVNPAPLAEGDETEAPVAPPKPGTKPNPPGILPGTRPSVDPAPIAKDVVDRFMKELGKSKSKVGFDINKLKKVYGKKGN